MTLASATLATGFETLEVTDNVNVAIGRIATAFTDYMAGSSVLGVSALPAILEAAPKTAMIGAMSGLNSLNGAAAAITAGITAFWNSLLGIEATIWIMVPPVIIVPSTLIVPAGLAGLQSVIQGAFDTNVNAKATLPVAAATLATEIHSTQLGATVQTQSVPSPPVVSPIL
jgi:hypothetical protein